MMHPIENMMKTSMEQIREMVDVNTIIGDPVHTAEGTIILPVSKVSFGFVSGGGEYGTGGSIRETGKDLTENPFAGGSGAGISLQPVGFVVVSGETIRLLPIQATCVMDHIAEMVPNVLAFAKEAILTFCAKKDEKEQKEKAEQCEKEQSRQKDKQSSYASAVFQQEKSTMSGNSGTSSTGTGSGTTTSSTGTTSESKPYSS